MVASDTALSTGPTFDDAADAGGNLNAQQTAQLYFGRPLTNAEVAQARTNDLAYQNAQLASQSFSQRYFQITNPNSLINHVAMDLSAHLNMSIFTNIVTLIGGMLSPLQSLFNFASSLSPQAALAATNPNIDTQDYGILQWGWSNDEEVDVYNGSYAYPNSGLAGDPNTGIKYSYSPIENQDSYNNRAFCTDYYQYINGTADECADWENYNDLIPELYSECFSHTADGQIDNNETISDLLTQPDIDSAPILRDKDTGDIKSSGGHLHQSVTATAIYNAKGVQIGTHYVLDMSSVRIDPAAGYCNPTELGANNPEKFGIPIDQPFGDIVFRYRLEMNYELVLDQLESMQGTNNSSSNPST
jgi:hypothetical protein